MILKLLSGIVLLLCFVDCVDEVRQLAALYITRALKYKVDGAVLLPLVACAATVALVCLHGSLFVKFTAGLYLCAVMRELYLLWRLKGDR